MTTLTVQSEKKTQLLDITDAVNAAVRGRSAKIATVFVPHTTAGVLLQAGGDGAREVAGDVEGALDGLVDESRQWRHSNEGDRNPASHIRAAVIASSVVIPVVDGELALGKLQRVFLAEFDGPRERSVYVAVA